MTISVINWINPKDELPEIGVDIFFIYKQKSYIAERDYCFTFAFGDRYHNKSSSGYRVISDYDLYLLSYETVDNEAVICWAYAIDADEIAKEMERN